MYRPEGMKKNPYPDTVVVPMVQDMPSMGTMMHRAYEAGADAMLEGLKKEGIQWKDVKELGVKWMAHVDSDEDGYLVFIPEGEE